MGDVVTFLDERRRPVRDADRASMRGTIPYYGASGIIDYVNDYLFDEDLILLGEDGENILSRNRRLAFRIAGKAWVNNHAHVLRPNSDVDIGYLSDSLESLNYEQFNSGTAQPKLTKQTCFGILIPLPLTLAEQEAIAKALNDADALIESLEQLLTKKRQIKKGAMQELLTGKNRLPQFDGKWQTTALECVVEIKNGATPSTQITAFWNGSVPWCRPTDITGTTGKYLLTTERSITAEGLASCGATLLPAGTLLLCSRATIGEIKIATSPVCTNQGFKSLVCKDGVSNEFLYYVLVTLKPQLLKHASGSTFLEIGKRDVAAIQVMLPSYAEQTAIATILSDMDAEITALEAKLSKARQIKQGMMQELLTGRIRLL